MAKRYRSPEQRGAETTLDSEQGTDLGLDNALLLSQLGGGEQAGMGEIAELTQPRIERAMLALSLQARPLEQVERFSAILEKSALSSDRRGELVLRLQQNQALATSVTNAVERFFGGDSPALRDELVKSLDAVWQGLARGGADGAEWQLGEVRMPLSQEALSGGEVSRSQALLTDLSSALCTPDAQQAASDSGHQAGPALAALVRSIQGLVGLDEEEEEELAFGGIELS